MKEWNSQTCLCSRCSPDRSILLSKNNETLPPVAHRHYLSSSTWFGAYSSRTCPWQHNPVITTKVKRLHKLAGTRSLRGGFWRGCHARMGLVHQAHANTWCFHGALMKMQIARSRPGPAESESLLGPWSLWLCILKATWWFPPSPWVIWWLPVLETSGQERSYIQCYPCMESPKYLWTRCHEEAEGASEGKPEKPKVAFQDDTTLYFFLSTASNMR